MLSFVGNSLPIVDCSNLNPSPSYHYRQFGDTIGSFYLSIRSWCTHNCFIVPYVVALTIFLKTFGIEGCAMVRYYTSGKAKIA